ncbi:MAG: LuxR C-terminal-related transcriptional regulator, partial [Acidimicrobiia bacterium]
ALGQPLAIVLDDYHRIQISSPVHDVMGRLLEHPSASVRLVLVTRRDPPLPFMSLLAGNQVAEVRLEDLRFTGRETAEFLSATAELAVSDTALANLEQQVEGWAAGLRLVVLALRHAVDPESLLGGLRGGLPQTRAYLLREALSGLSPEDRDWLLRSSILDRFCPPLLEAVCCPDGASSHSELTGRKFLDLIQRNNLFTIALDTKGEWFRYHHLFQDLLQRQLRETSSSKDIASLHLRAGEWFESEGLIDEALKHTLAADELELAAQLVERHRIDALNADQWYVLEKWLSRLPDSIVQQHAELLIARAWILLRQLRFEAMLPIVDRIDALLDGEGARQSRHGEVALFRGFVLFFQGHGAKSLEVLEEATERIPDSYHEPWCEAETIFALANQMEGRKEQALCRIAKLLNRLEGTEDLRMKRLLAIPVFIQLISADLGQARASNRLFREITSGGSHAHVEAWSAYLEGLILLYRHEPDAAVETLTRSVKQRFIHHKKAAVDSLAGLAMAHQSLGREDEVEATLRQLREFAVSLNDPGLSAMAESAEARLAIYQQRPEMAIRWLERAVPPPPEVTLFWFEIPSVTWCRALIAEGSATRLGEAEDQLRELSAMNEAHHNNCHLIEALTLLALTCEKQGKAEEALGYLERAATLARPGGFIFPFVEAGPTMAGMLERLLESDEADFVRRVLSAFSKRPVAARATAAPAPETARQLAAGSAAPENLTNRELDVLELLAERLQNKEIASRLGVSNHTVSYHLKSIYSKLGVGGRRQAVAAAIRDGLIKL